MAKNLVVSRPVVNGRTRLMLLETVGSFARDRLPERPDEVEVRSRHCDHFLALAERAASELERSDPPAVMAELDREVHNLRAALTWALDRHEALSALRLATALQEYWERRDPREGARWLRAAIALPDDDAPCSVRAAALGALAFCLIEPGTIEDAEEAARESLELARSIGDVARCAASTTALAIAALDTDRGEDGYRHATEAERLAREARDEPKRVIALHIRALTAPTFARSARAGRASGGGASPRGQRSATRTTAEQPHLQRARPRRPCRGPAADAGSAPIGQDKRRPVRPELRLRQRGACEAARRRRGARFGSVHARAAAERTSTQTNGWSTKRSTAWPASPRRGARTSWPPRLSGAAETISPGRHHPAIAQQLEDRCFGPARDTSRRAGLAGGTRRRGGVAPREAVQAALNAHQVVSSPSG